MPTPLRSSGDEDESGGPEAPEAQFISALLESGQFNPEKYHVSVDDLACLTQLWTFCLGVQEKSGAAPSLELVKRRFPEFEYTPKAPPGWAADELLNASAKRRLRIKLREALLALDANNLDLAYGSLSNLDRPRSLRREPLNIWAHPNDSYFNVSKLPVPWVSLQRTIGGIGPGELLYIAARPGEGKTYTLCEYLAKIIETGPYVVRYGSLEMPAEVIKTRILRCLANPFELQLLDSVDIADVKQGIDLIKDRTPGTVEVFDPSHGTITNKVLREHMEDCDLIAVDHIGLMRTSDGKRAIDDWRVMASISNTLMEDKLATSTSVIAAVQLNRNGEVSQSDSILQDADVLIKMRRISKHVMRHSAVKVRNQPGTTWYSRYDPATADFAELTRDQAEAARLIDDDFDLA